MLAKLGRFSLTFLDGIPLLLACGILIFTGVFSATGKTVPAYYLFGGFLVSIIGPIVGYVVYSCQKGRGQ